MDDNDDGARNTLPHARAVRRAAPLHVVNLLVSTVVAGARVSLAVLVGQAAAEGLEDGGRRVVFRGNQSDAIFLARFFGFDDFEGFGVGCGKVRGGPRSERTKGRARGCQQSTDSSSEHSRTELRVGSGAMCFFWPQGSCGGSARISCCKTCGSAAAALHAPSVTKMHWLSGEGGHRPAGPMMTDRFFCKLQRSVFTVTV
jgi:hypothetical protein